MSEQPKQKEAWSIYTGEGECLGDFETKDMALDVVNEQRGDFVVHRVELRDGESIIGPEERAVIEAAMKYCADAGRMEKYALFAAVRALREARK